MEAKTEIDYSKISPELRKKLAQWESNSLSNKQLQLLERIANKEPVVLLMGDGKATAQHTTSQLSVLLGEIRDSLEELNGKETPGSPDYASPVVEALQRLETVLADTITRNRPKLNVPTPVVKAPNVHVAAPDLRELEQLVRNEIPKAFEKAIRLIPKTEIPKPDHSKFLDKLDSILTQLESIDTAARLKPQFPISQLNTIAENTTGPSVAQVTTVGDTTTSKVLIDPNPDRKEVEFLNGSSAILYLLKGGGVASSTNYTVYLNEGDYYSSDSKAMFTGVWASDAGGSVQITENE